MNLKNPIRFLMRVPVPWVFVLTYLAGVGLESLRPASGRVRKVPLQSEALDLGKSRYACPSPSLA